MTLKKTVTQGRKPQATSNYAAKYNYASAQTNSIEDEEEKEEAAFNICSNLSIQKSSVQIAGEDHKPFSHNERMLVESLGGFIRDRYLNGELGVTRALVDFVKRRLQDHNDVKRCCKETVEEAIKGGAGDNLAVVIVCFQSHPPPRMVVQRGREEFKGSLPILLELRKYRKYTEGLGMRYEGEWWSEISLTLASFVCGYSSGKFDHAFEVFRQMGELNKAHNIGEMLQEKLEQLSEVQSQT
ncbi:probable protein phosphatase 2C 27 [Tanacetum coccineum]